MNKTYSFLIFLSLLIFSLSFVSSNFVCGIVNNSQNFSSSWANVIIYPNGDISNYTKCEVNPENKFCCDVEEIHGFTPSIGKRVFAEVFDKEGGFVGGPVSLTLTEEGYDIFPQMSIQKAITVNFPTERIFINQSSILLNVSLADSYNNLNYTINSSGGLSNHQVCNNCTNIIFPVNLSKGNNEITFIAYGSRNISEKIIIYNLDYLNFSINAYCDKCKIKKNFLYVPSNENITFSSSFNASHNISGDFLFYFPSDWVLFNSSDLEDFSTTHNVLSENVVNQNKFSINYTLMSPKTLIKEEYFFTQGLENKELTSKVVVFKFKLIPFRKSNPLGNYYFTLPLIQRGSPTQPIILYSNEDYLKLVVIYPKENITKSYSSLDFTEKKKGKIKEYYFTILTSIPSSSVDNILLIFKSEKGKQMEVYEGNSKLNLSLYQEDSNYVYYSSSVNTKGPFQVKIL
jgi:hypothetical protein